MKVVSDRNLLKTEGREVRNRRVRRERKERGTPYKAVIAQLQQQSATHNRSASAFFSTTQISVLLRFFMPY